MSIAHFIFDRYRPRFIFKVLKYINPPFIWVVFNELPEIFIFLYIDLNSTQNTFKSIYEFSLKLRQL